MLKPHIKNVFRAAAFGFMALCLFAVVFLSTQSQKQTQDYRSHAQTPTTAALPLYPGPVGQTGNWNVIFADDFNNPALDTSKWTAGWFGTGITGPINTSETACYDSAQVIQPGDGYVHLNLIAKPSTCKSATRPNTGALISSNGKFSYTYGYVEFRAYIPPASPGIIANWPALWTDGNIWPTDGENDTMEGLSNQACFHFHSPIGGPGACVTGDYTGWHIFASDWEPGSVTYYYDGVKVGQITTGVTTSPQYVILNNSAGSIGGPLVVPSDMRVDYVRVWQMCTANCVIPTPTNASVAAITTNPTVVLITTAPPTPTIDPMTDSTSPSVKITYPNNRNTVPKNTTITLTANAADNVGVSQVEFLINNVVQCTTKIAPYTCNYAVSNRSRAIYTATAKAYDVAGNTATSTIRFYSSR